MTVVDRLADALAQAHRSSARIQLDAELDALPVDDAPAVQAAVMQRLGETAPGSKVAITKTGRAVVAPLIASRFVLSGATLPLHGTIGLEVEIAVLLRRDLTPDLAAEGPTALLTAIDAFYVGIELIGSRIFNHRDAGPGVLLADNLISNGYATNLAQPYPHGTDISDAIVTVQIDGMEVHRAPAVNPFGGVLVALEAYARSPFDTYNALRAGQIVTTGTLCGVIAVSGPCEIWAAIGDGTPIHLSLL